MTEEEKIHFLSEKIQAINTITTDIARVFPEKSFKLDGILAGNIVEIMAAHIYGIKLYRQSEKTHDGEVNGRKIQIKGTQSLNGIIISEEPEYLIVEYLDKNKGIIQEIYNGPGSLAWKYRSYVLSQNHYTIRVSKLLELDQQVAEVDRIKPVFPIEKYMKTYVTNHVAGNFNHSTSKSSRGKTLVTGYINRNQQINMGCLNKSGNHYNQQAYQMKCSVCGHVYEANGCDIGIRKCPKCMKK